MKRLILEQDEWEAAAKEQANLERTGNSTSTTKPVTTGGTKTNTGGTKSGGGTLTTNKGGGTSGGGSNTNKSGSAADKMKKGGQTTKLVAEADTIQSYIYAAYRMFSQIAPLTAGSNIPESSVHQVLYNYISKGSSDHIKLKCMYLDFILRVANPSSSISTLIKQNPVAWNYVIRAKKGLTVQAIRQVRRPAELRVFNDFINPKSKLGDWLDAHDATQGTMVDTILRILERNGIITVTENVEDANEIIQTKFIKARSSEMWNKKVLTLYTSKAYG